jgi:CDP-glucose 4,6-dehydratase
MAAQPLVINSYKNPYETFEINAMGTVNLLDAAFKVDSVKIIIVVTTDKVYENDNSGKRFSETDPLKGKDPYSASKVSAESAVLAWQHISKFSNGPKVVSVRAGNVIGGGDLSENRLFPDIVRSYISGNSLDVRNPNSTRPWQHVLDPLAGYLNAIEYLLAGNSIDSINFGPSEKSMTVSEALDISSKIISIEGMTRNSIPVSRVTESSILNLDSSFANTVLNWYPKFNQEISIQKTLNWWINVLDKKLTADAACEQDILSYMSQNN